MFFCAVNQINLGGPSAISDREDYFIMATYNLMAGKRAMAMSEFHTAYNLFDNGINFLRKNHWHDNYSFSLEIFDLAAKAALASGNTQGLQIITDHVLRRGRCFEDKLNAHFIILCSKTHTPRPSDAIEKGLAIVGRLGINIPINPSQPTVDLELQQTLLAIGSLSETNLLNYATLTDMKMSAAMKFLGKLLTIAHLENPALLSFILLKMVQISISFGLSPSSPLAFASFGSLVAKSGKVELGGLFTMWAKSLSEKLGSKEVAGEVICVVAEVQSFVQPLQAANELHIQGEEASISAGDINFACYNRLLYSVNLFWSGVDLSTVATKINKACVFMKDASHNQTLLFMLLMQGTVNILSGADADYQKRIRMLEEMRRHNSPGLQLIM
jgi:predicted ATPase